LIGFIGGIVVCYLVPRQHTPGTIFALFLSAVAIGVFILCLQGLVICAALRQGDRLWSFYEKLSDHRENANKGEIVDSYRHLREHGNSFFIVFLEITLGIILVGTSAAAGLFDTASPPDGLDGRFVYPLLVIITWILPAVFVWLIATQFERKFIDAPPQELPD
jgi:ABC-type sugar transport system permease subunit